MSMELDNVFSVPTSPARAWEVLLDVERIAPCMPGATVEEFDGEVVTGRIKVKVGPAILKRVIPVAAVAAVLALLGRRFRHLLQRGTRKG